MNWLARIWRIIWRTSAGDVTLDADKRAEELRRRREEADRADAGK